MGGADIVSKIPGVDGIRPFHQSVGTVPAFRAGGAVFHCPLQAGQHPTEPRRITGRGIHRIDALHHQKFYIRFHIQAHKGQSLTLDLLFAAFVHHCGVIIAVQLHHLIEESLGALIFDDNFQIFLQIRFPMLVTLHFIYMIPYPLRVRHHGNAIVHKGKSVISHRRAQLPQKRIKGLVGLLGLYTVVKKAGALSPEAGGGDLPKGHILVLHNYSSVSASDRQQDYPLPGRDQQSIAVDLGDGFRHRLYRIAIPVVAIPDTPGMRRTSAAPCREIRAAEIAPPDSLLPRS